MFVEGFLQKTPLVNVVCIYLFCFIGCFSLAWDKAFPTQRNHRIQTPRCRKYMAYSRNTNGFSRISISGRFYTRRIYEMPIVANAKYINTVPCHSWSASHEPLLQARDSLTLWPQMPKHKNMTYGLILKTILNGIMEHLYIIEGSREESRIKQEKHLYI